MSGGETRPVPPALLTGRHVMLDGETFSTGKSGVFFQIGGCEFFPEEDRLGRTFNRYIDLGSSLAVGRTMDPDTILYWMGMEGDARLRMLAGLKDAPSLVQVLGELADFCQISNGRQGLGQKREGADGVWSHGGAFDVAMLEDTYAAFGMEAPWHHRDPLDTRTIFRLAGFSLGRFIEQEMTWPETAAPHVEHDGESDAIAQALGVMEALKRLRREP